MIDLRTPTIEGLHEQEHGLHLRAERIELFFGGRHSGGEGWGFGFARQRVGWLGWRWWRIDWELEIDRGRWWQSEWGGRKMDRQGGKLASVVESVTVEVGEGGGGRIEQRRGRIRQRRRWGIRCIDRATTLDSTVGDGILRIQYQQQIGRLWYQMLRFW